MEEARQYSVVSKADWDKWTTGNFGHEFMFGVIAWNCLEHTSRVLLSAVLDANHKTEALFHDFTPGHLSNALKLAITKCDNELLVSELEHFAKAFEILMTTRNTLVHNLVAVMPSPDGKSCEGVVIGQRVRAKHELIESRLSESQLEAFFRDCWQFTSFADHLISEFRPEETNLELSLRSARREMGHEENKGKRPNLPSRLQLKKTAI